MVPIRIWVDDVDWAGLSSFTCGEKTVVPAPNTPICRQWLDIQETKYERMTQTRKRRD